MQNCCAGQPVQAGSESQSPEWQPSVCTAPASCPHPSSCGVREAFTVCLPHLCCCWGPQVKTTKITPNTLQSGGDFWSVAAQTRNSHVQWVDRKPTGSTRPFLSSGVAAQSQNRATTTQLTLLYTADHEHLEPVGKGLVPGHGRGGSAAAGIPGLPDLGVGRSLASQRCGCVGRVEPPCHTQGAPRGLQIGQGPQNLGSRFSSLWL